MTSQLSLRHAAGPVAVAALLVSTAAPAPLCVDAKGHKVYQQSPCPDLNVRSGIEPIVAEALTQQNVVETLKRFDAALAKRDVPAVASFLDDEFTSASYAVDGKDTPPRRVDGFNRKSYINSINRAVRVISKYQAARSNCKVQLQEAEATASCENREAAVVTSHTAKVRSREEARLVIRKGRVMLRALDSYVYDFELSTKSVPVKR